MLKKIFRKKKRRLKQHVHIKQNAGKVHIGGFLSNENYVVKKLHFIARDYGNRVEFSNLGENNEFIFNFELDERFNTSEDVQHIYDLFLIVRVHEQNLSEKKINTLKKHHSTEYDEVTGEYEYPLRLGRFDHTETEDLNPATINNTQYQLYKTVKGNISLVSNISIQQEIKTQINFLKSKKHNLLLKGNIFTRTNTIKSIDLVMVGRNFASEGKVPVHIRHLLDETKIKFGLNRYEFNADLSFDNPSIKRILTEDVYDLFFDITFENNEGITRVRLGKPRFLARYRLKSSHARVDKTIFTINPYYTFRLQNLSLQLNSFEVDVYKYLRRSMRWAFFVRLFNKRKNIWLVGERSDKAEDTGFHFFRYMRINHKEKNVYYVIDKDSPNKEDVEKYGNVVYFKTKEHVQAVISASRIIGSHHPDYLFPLRTKEFEQKVKAKKVFLQHGVMGTKNMVANYGKNALGFDTNMFLVSSNSERQMIINDFGYDARDVKVTGLSRFDTLFKNDVQKKRQLLIIPTWREWLIRDDLFIESEYFDRYKELVTNEYLHQIAKEHNFEIVFSLHPNMRRFAHYFEDTPVRIIYPGEVDVQKLLKESTMMITDYSSVAFDFSFLKKPIIYYQFDRCRFIGRRGSHLDLDNDLPGDIVFNLEDVLASIYQYVLRNFEMKPENEVKALMFITHRDQNSSERIYNVIKNEVRKKTLAEILVESELSKVAFNRFRKSKLYFPTMKIFYNIARRVLPVDNKLVLFESGVGKQYADSPRAIYEEIVNQDLDFKKVWVSNKSIRFRDIENTIQIKRLSPSYYYYLARAKYWVNNQNFPTYIKKRKNTTYLQTWHGTPLKKMLHDIKNITGRSEDYLERVSSAINRWDYLISPSEYASKAFRSAFKYKGEILQVGYPRNDLFYNSDQNQIIKEAKRKLNLLEEDRKIILYAPTFRDNQTSKKNSFTFDIEMDLQEMQKELGDDYIVLLRMHVVVKNKIKIPNELQGFVKDVSSFSDMQELLLITDILITDYSSVMFDFANTKKPMLFYTYDLETYRDDVRGFYLDFERESPGPLVCTTTDIIDSVEDIDVVQERYRERYSAFLEKYCKLEDGHASKRVVDRLFISKES